ncbi:hypothetical protein FB567DRAFT_224608 [Paraphoma chrysanthemicola]|uniref:Uncharacterized protein n=1 Tax=Paraphoma chrysanthemicola TaxID=798071 RepID=A0A8K0VSQ4_9PLEO|nr:hypothetical protein FB567DRAFT_224608 [Paraphoma chrysanthemicola]
METDWHRRGHSMHPASASSVLPTLPSVAELLASSQSTSDSIPAYHHPSSRQHVSRSTPPSAPMLSTAANAASSASTEHSYFAAYSHASQASPTESATSTSPSEPHAYYQVAAHHSSASASSFTPASTAGPAHGLDAPRPQPQPPMNARRQDSIIAHQRLEASKDGSSSVPDANFAYSHRSPNDNYRPTSPASTSYQLPHTSLPPMHHHSASAPASHENAQFRPGTDSAPKGVDALQPDHSNTTIPRQQRYNVRFAANHTPANMPVAQKSRQSPPLPTPPAQPEVVPSPPRTPDEPAGFSDEPAIQAIQRSLQRSEDQQQSDSRDSEPRVERCLVCHETWTRPLFNPSALGSNSSAKSTNEMDKATSGFMNIVEQLQQHSKDADANYAQWIALHSKCPRSRKGSSPSPATSVQSAPTGGSNGMSESQTDGHINTNSNKRKPEALHPDTQKLRKVTLDTESPSSQFARPSATT